MNRKSFLASLIALPAGLVAAAKGVTLGASNDYFQPINAQIGRRRGELLVANWLQTTRIGNYASMDYLDELDRIMIPDEATRRLNYHERRKERSRQNIAELRRTKVLPLP